MRLLLISANRERSPYPVFPLGLACLTTVLDQAGHELDSLDLCFEKSPEESLSRKISEFNPDFALVSIRNIDNVAWPAARSYLDGIRSIVSVCRGRVPVIAGGSGFSIMPREILEYIGADYGVVGEGEKVLPRLLERLQDRTSIDGLPGVVEKGGGCYEPPAHCAIEGLPDRKLFNVTRYHQEGGMANIQTKRGCPFNCIYCTYPVLEGRTVRTRPVDDVVAELLLLRDKAAVSYVYFVDDIFNYPMDYALVLCRAIAEAKVGVSWSAFINPGFFDEELMEAMHEAGCDGVEFGSDSGSEVMLRNMGKSFGVDDLKKASRICRGAGVDFAHYVLFGGPGETEHTVRETFSLMDEMAPTAVIAMTGLRIYPGTPLHAIAIQEGAITPETDLLAPCFYISPDLSDRLGPLVTELAMERTCWAVPGLEVNMSDAMLEALRIFTVKGPLWKLLSRMGRSRFRPLS